jgi:hypothetical protein
LDYLLPPQHSHFCSHSATWHRPSGPLPLPTEGHLISISLMPACLASQFLSGVSWSYRLPTNLDPTTCLHGLLPTQRLRRCAV